MHMLRFRRLDVYRCAIELLPKAYAMANGVDAEMANQLRRAALSINLNIGEGTGAFNTTSGSSS
jgi:four helix bundle protein